MTALVFTEEENKIKKKTCNISSIFSFSKKNKEFLLLLNLETLLSLEITKNMIIPYYFQSVEDTIYIYIFAKKENYYKKQSYVTQCSKEINPTHKNIS